MTDEMYKNILDENLFQSLKKLQLGNGMVFQHDSDPKHPAHMAKHWLDENQCWTFDLVFILTRSQSYRTSLR